MTSSTLYSVYARLHLQLLRLCFWRIQHQYFQQETCAVFVNAEIIGDLQMNFDVLLTVHLSIVLAINQLNAQNLLL